MSAKKTPSLALRAGLGLALLVLFPGVLRAAEAPPLVLYGHGLTRADAKEDALERVRELVVSLLRERRPDLKWTPSASYLRESGMARDFQDDPNYPSERLGPHYRVAVQVNVTEQDIRKMLHQDLLQHRHELTAKVLAALVALLAVLAGFFRLEDTTRGYYTNTLRVGLVACITAIGAVLWLVW
jgi:hypothetical protein